MLRRFDENGNGLIDPAESQGRAGFFLQRIASEVPGIDLSKPVPIEKLSQAMDRMRTQRDSGGGNNGSSNSSGRPSSGNASTTVEPLVPGFGVEDLLPPALGFGAEAELFTIKTTDADNREAEERFRRYDTNRDGVLDKNELARGRWSEDPLTYDRNHDGKLTLSEMAVRYAQRRVAEEASRAAQTASRSNASRDNRGGGGDRGGDRGNAARGGFGGFGGGGGEDPRSFFSRRDPGNGAETPNRDGSTSPSNATVDSRKSYRVKSVTERLPKGLPDWFARSDANADGQVAMAEFATSWSDSTLRDFQQFDLNNDGIITPSETLNAVNNGAVRGSTSSAAPSTTATSTTSSRPAMAKLSGGEAPKIDPRYVDYYQKLISKYDTNGDGVLVGDEWKAMSKDPSAADTDGDGRINVNELAAWSMKR
jgi:Ca2+-binding EF-hand superfamily protein